MSPHALIAVLVACIYAGLSAIHVYWACGGGWGSVGVIPVVGGKPTFQPSTGVTLLVALALGAAAALVLARGGLVPWPLPDALLRPATYLLGTVFALRAVGDFRLVGLFKRVRGTRFARLDSWVFVPLCSALAGATLWLA